MAVCMTGRTLEPAASQFPDGKPSRPARPVPANHVMVDGAFVPLEIPESRPAPPDETLPQSP